MADNYITAATEKGNVCISEDVIATIVGAAISEIDGVDGLASTVGDDIMEFVGIGTNFTNTKPALRAAFKRLRRDYDERHFTVGYYNKGRLTSFVL